MPPTFDETKYIYFLIKDEELLEANNEIWNKGSNLMKKIIVNKCIMKNM